MKKTKLVPITSLDQLEVGSVIADKGVNRRRILAKSGLLVWVSCWNQFGLAFGRPITIQELLDEECQLEVTEEPWRPNFQDTYFIPSIKGGEADVIGYGWGDYESDNLRLKAGLACKTKEEALAKAQKMLDSIKDSE